MLAGAGGSTTETASWTQTIPSCCARCWGQVAPHRKQKNCRRAGWNSTGCTESILTWLRTGYPPVIPRAGISLLLPIGDPGPNVSAAIFFAVLATTFFLRAAQVGVFSIGQLVEQPEHLADNSGSARLTPAVFSWPWPAGPPSPGSNGTRGSAGRWRGFFSSRVRHCG